MTSTTYFAMSLVHFSQFMLILDRIRTIISHETVHVYILTVSKGRGRASFMGLRPISRQARPRCSRQGYQEI